VIQGFLWPALTPFCAVASSRAKAFCPARASDCQYQIEFLSETNLGFHFTLMVEGLNEAINPFTASETFSFSGTSRASGCQCHIGFSPKTEVPTEADLQGVSMAG
jgi:hypothetical protein